MARIPVPTLVWTRHDGGPLPKRIEIKTIGSILISNITASEAGEYKCTATNILVGKTSKTTLIIVQQPYLNVTISPNVREMTIVEGDKLKLFCGVDGGKPSTVRWLGPSELGQQGFLPNSYKYTSMNFAIFQKNPIRRRHEGIYICQASNEDEQIQEKIYVFVQPK